MMDRDALGARYVRIVDMVVVDDSEVGVTTIIGRGAMDNGGGITATWIRRDLDYSIVNTQMLLTGFI